MMRIAVTGAQGQVARALAERGEAQGHAIIALARPNMDLTDPLTILPAIKSAAPDVVVNAAAYTAVDKAETEQPLARLVNGAGAGMVALAAARVGVPVIHLSTDYVFDGRLVRAYREDDPTGPLCVYGLTKREGEQAVRLVNRRHVIVRTSWVYSPFGTNFVRTMLRLGETHDEIKVIDDQIGCPTSAFDIADGVLDICRALQARPQDESLYGVFHLAGEGAASWADFAEAIFAEAAQRGRADVAVKRIPTSAFPVLARRPANSRLDTHKLAAVYATRSPPWRNSLSCVVHRLLQKM